MINVKAIFFLVFSLAAAQSFADVSFLASQRILNTAVFDSANGVCRAKLSGNINTDGDAQLTCGNSRFVSFGCDGVHNTKSAGQLMFTQAQLAQVTGKLVNVYIDDTKVYNANVCTATFIAVNG